MKVETNKTLAPVRMRHAYKLVLLGAGQPDPHEKTILQRLVYAYITTYRSSEGAPKTPRAFLKVLGCGRAAQRVALVGAPYR